MAIDEESALRSASWGLGQIMGFNCKLANYPSAEAMAMHFLDDEDRHLQAMIRFIKATGLDDELRRHDWKGFARGYNGAGFAKNGYDQKLAAAFAKWQRIKDTPVPAGKTYSSDAPDYAAKPIPPPTPPNPPAQRVGPVSAPTPAPKVNGALKWGAGALAVGAFAAWDQVTAWASGAAQWVESFFN